MKIKRLLDSYRNFLLKLLNYEAKMQINPVDFAKPWYQPILNRKWRLGGLILIVLLGVAYQYLTPIIIAFGIEKASFWLLFWLLFVPRVVYLLTLKIALDYNAPIFQLQTWQSVAYQANKFFLTVDPLWHTTRESGKVISKVNRSTLAYEKILVVLLFRVVPLVTGFIVASLTLLLTNLWLGLTASLFILAITILVAVLSLVSEKAFRKEIIRLEDDVAQVTVENLQQTTFIRSLFMTDRQLWLHRQKAKKCIAMEGSSWFSYNINFIIIELLYSLSTLVIGWQILHLINTGTLGMAVGISLMSTYILSTMKIFEVGEMVIDFTKARSEIIDLHTFIRQFGKQTFPVVSQSQESCFQQTKTKCTSDSSISSLSDDTKLSQNTEVIEKKPTGTSTNLSNTDKNTQANPKNTFQSIQIQNLGFDYDLKTKLFEKHSLELKTSSADKNKLFGIIGQSGAGKTTLVSILGGQLKPTSGQVLIDGIDIYKVKDSTRRRLIAMQLQTATSLRGSLRYSLTFGLEKHSLGFYDDQKLIQVLKNVGLWNTFVDKQGLDSLIGEGGVNLSGGQRQRLNFASLYLRAKLLRPSLILIDEPTSSLDQISEEALTRMILELSQIGLTLVVAHRLQTLAKATGILDFSLLNQQKHLRFYSPQELAKTSKYYQELLVGKQVLDS